MRHRFTLPLLLLGLLTLPTAADPPRPNISPEIIYTSRKEFLHIAPARPLTLNAHLTQFAYEPLGLEVATVGSETTGDTTTYFVKTLDARTGHELHRLSLTSTPLSDGGKAGFKMLGWTPSGKYILLERTQGAEDSPGESVTDLVRWDLSADPPKVRPITPEVALPPGAAPSELSTAVSPHGRWILFNRGYAMPDAHGKLGPAQRAYTLYDPEQNTSRPLTLPQNASLSYETWPLDDTHLHIHIGETGVAADKWLDVVTGQITAPNVSALPPVSKQYPDLTLNVEDRPQIDQTRVSQFPSHIVWVYCPPRLKQTLSAVGAGITMGEEDPQAVWSPAGKQIAFLNRGDLYVSDVSPIPPSEFLANEKTALGLPLSCPEERTIATSNLKQIGLGITQYTQDWDEKFPPADGIDEAIYPYIKVRSVFSVGGVHWAYHAPENLSLAAMDSPADTVLGTMKLPCGQIVLYADGHVKQMLKEQAAP